MALVLVEGEEKVPGLLNTANVSVIAMTPQAINLEASAASRSRPAKESCYTLLLACITGFAAVFLE